MPDLDRALRDLLTDDRLDIPVRPDAGRIVQDGVRRRRRRRTLATTIAVATTTGVAVAAALAVPALVTADANHPTLPTEPRLGYDVPWVGDPAPTPWSPTAPPATSPTMDSPRCRADQLHAGPVNSNAAGGLVFVTIRLRNVSAAPCLLVGSPLRVAATGPGRPDIVAARGLALGSGGMGGDLAPGHRGYLTLQTDRDCAPSAGTYTSVSVTLPSGTSFAAPARLDGACGFKTGGLGIDVAQPKPPADPRSHLVATIETRGPMHPGAAAYVVTLINPTGTAISFRHCPGYAQDMTAGALALTEESYALNCSSVHGIAAHSSVRYQMHVHIPVDVTPGTYLLSWRLFVGHPVSATTPVTVTTASG